MATRFLIYITANTGYFRLAKWYNWVSPRIVMFHLSLKTRKHRVVSLKYWRLIPGELWRIESSSCDCCEPAPWNDWCYGWRPKRTEFVHQTMTQIVGQSTGALCIMFNLLLDRFGMLCQVPTTTGCFFGPNENNQKQSLELRTRVHVGSDQKVKAVFLVCYRSLQFRLEL